MIFELDEDTVSSTPFVDRNGNLLFVTEKGKLYRINLQNNTTDPIFKEVPDNPGQVGYTIGGVVCDKNGQYAVFSHQTYGLVVVNLVDRSQPQLQEVSSRYGRASTGPTLVPDRGKITAYAATEKGYLLGRIVEGAGQGGSAPGDGMRISDRPIYSRPAVWKRLLFAVDDAGTIHAINLDQRSQWWEFRIGHQTRAPVWVDQDAGIIVVADQEGCLTALKWYYNDPKGGVELLEKWGEHEAAGNLAFVHQYFEQARDLWNRTDCDLCKAILAECNGQTQAAITFYQQAEGETRNRNNGLAQEIQKIIKELNSPAGQGGDSAQPGLPEHNGGTACSTFQLEALHTPNIEVGQTGELWIKLKRRGPEVVPLDVLTLAFGGDVQYPLPPTSLPINAREHLKSQGEVYIKVEISPSRQGRSLLWICVQYRDATGHRCEARLNDHPIYTEPRPVSPIIFNAPVVAGDGFILVRSPGESSDRLTYTFLTADQSVTSFDRKTCPRCGSRVASDHVFCASCGAKLGF